MPNEAFQLRHEIFKFGNSPDLLVPSQNGHESPSSAGESEFGSSVAVVAESNMIKEEILSVPPFTSQLPTWHFTDLVCAMLHHYAENVNIQSGEYHTISCNSASMQLL